MSVGKMLSRDRNIHLHNKKCRKNKRKKSYTYHKKIALRAKKRNRNGRFYY